MKKIVVWIMIAVSCLALAGCGGKENKDAAAQPVKDFYTAITQQDRNKVSSISCSEWESAALREVDAFMGVKSELKDFSCTVSEQNGDSAVVTCTGSIAASYGAEVTDFPISGKSHKVIKEQGEWRICGY